MNRNLPPDQKQSSGGVMWSSNRYNSLELGNITEHESGIWRSISCTSVQIVGQSVSD